MHSVRQVNAGSVVGFEFDETFNLSVPFLDRHLEAGKGAREVLRWRDRAVTFTELYAKSCALAHIFTGLGISPDDRVLILVRDAPEFHFAFLGAVRCGAIAVPVNYFLRSADYEHMLRDSGARAVVASREVMPELIPALETTGQSVAVRLAVDEAPEGFYMLAELLGGADKEFDPFASTALSDCFWLYSSGSTGSPKASVHQHKDMIYTSQYYGMGVVGLDETQSALSPAKLFFAYGLGNSLSFPLWTGNTAIMMAERPTPEGTLDMIARTRPDVLFGIPTLYAGMLKLMENGHPFNVSSLRQCPSGGEPLPPALYERWKEITGLEITDSLGSSEALHFYTANRPGSVQLGSAGRIVAGYEGRIVDPEGNDLPDGEVGELAIRGKSVAEYYWQRPEQTARAMRGGWFHTGDMCRRDEEGYYFFGGRGNDMLKVGGIWVSPFEVESALVAHDAVLEAAVTGAPDPEGLIKPAAYVVLKDRNKASDVLGDELRQFVRDRLAPFKYPRWIHFVDDLPKTSSGKIQRFRLGKADYKLARGHPIDAKSEDQDNG